MKKNLHQNCNFCIEKHVEENWWCLTSKKLCTFRSSVWQCYDVNPPNLGKDKPFNFAS